MTKTSVCENHPPDGVLACGCTTDVIERLYEQAGIRSRPERNLWAVVKEHVAPHVGPLEGVLHDGEDGPVWADLLVHRPSGSHPTADLITAGMSARRMRPPRVQRRRGVAERAELVLRFPREWMTAPSVTQTLLTFRNRWAATWLQIAARVPHEVSRYLGDDRGLDIRFRAIPFDLPGSPFYGAIAADPARLGRPIPPLRAATPSLRPGAHTVRFLSLVPIHEREFEFAVDRGAEALFAALRAAGVDDLVRPGRRHVV